MNIEVDTCSNIVVYPIKVKRRGCINYNYIVFNQDSKEAIIVDPAWEEKTLNHAIENLQVTVVGVLLTHYHSDHVNLANTFAKKYNIPVFISQIEQEFYGFTCENMRQAIDGQSFSIESITVYPILTAGHTKGSICYLIGENLFTGDTIFIEGCGMMFGEGSDAKDMYNSILYLKQHLPKTVIIYPGHSYGEECGKPFSYLLKYNIYFHFPDYDQFAKFRLRENQSGWFNFK